MVIPTLDQNAYPPVVPAGRQEPRRARTLHPEAKEEALVLMGRMGTQRPPLSATR